MAEELIAKIEAACDVFRTAPEMEALDSESRHDLLDCPMPSMLLPVSIAYFTMCAKAAIVSDRDDYDSLPWFMAAMALIVRHYGPATELVCNSLKDYSDSGVGRAEMKEFQKGLCEVCSSKDDYILMSIAFRAAFWVYVECYQDMPFDFERQQLLTRAYFRAMLYLNEQAASWFGGMYQNEFNL